MIAIHSQSQSEIYFAVIGKEQIKTIPKTKEIIITNIDV